MNSQLFTAKLAEKTNIKEVEVSIFIETFILGFATKLQTTRKASFDPFGVFEVIKRVEYINERKDGSKVLCPPCLEAEFSSSAILGVLKLSEVKENQPIYDLFAQRYEWEEEAVALFIAQIKSVIKSQLLKDKMSSIPGFGVFEGELGGDITFTPAKQFAKLINKPFSHFKPVELSVSETELKSVAGVETLTNAEPSSDSLDEPEPVQSKETPKQAPIDSPREEAIKKEEPVAESMLVAEKDIEDNARVQEEESTLSGKVAEKVDAVSERSIQEELAITAEYDAENIAGKSVQEADNETSTQPQESEVEASTQEDTTSSDQIVMQLENKLSDYDERLEKIESKLKNKDQMLRHYKRLAIFLTIIVIAILIFWYWSATLHKTRYEKLSTVELDAPELVVDDPHLETEPIVPLLSDSTHGEQQDSLHQSTDSMGSLTHAEQLARSEEQFGKKDSVSVSSQTKPVAVKEVSQVMRHKLKSGETLRGLSLRYYNTKDKWELILKANKEVITDPDIIPEGTLLIIPKLD